MIARYPLPTATRRDHVFFRARPDAADDVIDREAGLGRGLDRHRRHDAPAAQEDPVRLELADARPLCGLVVARMRNRNLDVLEAVVLGEQRERRLRFLPVRRVVIERRDLQPFELVLAALGLGDVVDRRRGLAVEAQHQRKSIGEDATVDRFGGPVVEGRDRHLVGGRVLQQRLCDRIAVGQIDRNGRPVLAGAEALIAFDAFFDLPFGLAFFPEQLHAVDAALHLVDVAERVDDAAPKRNAARRVGTDAEGGERNKLLVGEPADSAVGAAIAARLSAATAAAFAGRNNRENMIVPFIGWMWSH